MCVGQLAASHWERFAQVVVPVFSDPFSDAIVEALENIAAGVVVDLACATGATTTALHTRFPDRTIVGIDVDPAAVTFAHRAGAALAWTAASGDALPLSAASVAAITVQQGAQFFADPDRTCRELRRVLMPGGVVVLLSWTRDGAPLFEALDYALIAAGAATEPQYGRPVAFDAAAWTAAGAACGLTTMGVDQVRRRLVVSDVRRFVEHFIEPVDNARRRAVDIAVPAIVDLVEADAPLIASRVALRRPMRSANATTDQRRGQSS